MGNTMRKMELYSDYKQSSITRLSSNEDCETIVNLKQKYKNSVLLEIYQSKPVLHSVLANRMQVSPSGLNAVIKRLNDVVDVPIIMDKRGKFTYYILSEIGSLYVEEYILPLFMECDKDKQVFENIHGLLNVFKDKHQTRWQEQILHIVMDESIIDDEGRGFIDELSYYCIREEEKVYELLKLLIPDRECYQPIMNYLKEASKLELKSAVEILNLWAKKNTKTVYLLLNAVFAGLHKDNEYPDCSDYNLRYVEQYMPRVCDWILAKTLKGIMQNYTEEEMAEYFYSRGLDEHLAWFVAEKSVALRRNI